MDLVKVADASEMEGGQVKTVSISGRKIALYRISGRFYATANECPHQRGPLGEGKLGGNVVTCPWHGWEFDVITGKSLFLPDLQISTYNVVEKEGGIFIEI
ncbi:Rieske (2Fe-2S) protein [archaeon]|nr:Rieske (2Fe-2S) protein [archaeon]